MPLLRHRQRAITSLTPKGAKWINPQKFAIPPEPIFALPATYYHFGATEGSFSDQFRAGLTPVYTLDTTAGKPWQLVFKLRLTTGGTAANQVMFQQGTNDKRFMYHNGTGAFRWIDPGGDITFTDPGDVGSVIPLFDTWYLVHIRNDLDIPGNTKLQLFTLPSEDLENGDLQGEKSVAQIAGALSGIAPFLGAGSAGATPTLGVRGDLANVIWGVNQVPGSIDDFYGGFRHHWPFNEGVGLSTNDVIEGEATGATPGDAGFWAHNP